MRQILNTFSVIKNAQASKKSIILLKRNKQLEELLSLLWFEGQILGYTLIDDQIKLFLKYKKNRPCILNFKTGLKFSYTVYLSLNQIWHICQNKSLIIFSTNFGLKTLDDCKQQKLGGKILFIVS